MCDWLNANKLTINAKKANFVIFRPSQKKLNYQISIRVYNNPSNSDTSLECKDYVKFLGVLIDKNLTWKYHYIYPKILFSCSGTIIKTIKISKTQSTIKD